MFLNNKKEKTYFDVFTKSLSCGVIPLGLYREGKRVRYVWTNPPLATELVETDVVFLVMGFDQIPQPDDSADPWSRSVVMVMN